MSSHLANPDFDEFSLPVHVHQRRIRHILSIQIRNFTPFPLRDAFTSSLAASGPPLLDAVDDIELTLSRRRMRRISTNSLMTVKSSRGDLDQSATTSQAEAAQGRPRANSRSVRKSAHLGYTQRPQRDRATSSASVRSTGRNSLYNVFAPSSEDSVAPVSPTAKGNNPEGHQKDLEQIMASRLVETFLSLEPLSQDARSFRKPQARASTSPVRAVNTSFDGTASRFRSDSAASQRTSPRTTTFQPITPQPSKIGNAPLDDIPRSSSPSASRTFQHRQNSSIAQPSTQSPRAKMKMMEPHRSSSLSISHALPTPAPSPPPENEEVSVPFYISPFHRPSTNPLFASIDVQHDFAPWMDLASQRFKAFLWGNSGSEWGKTAESKPVNPAGLALEIETLPPTADNWEVLASWDVDMDDLVPVPVEYLENPLSLPSNTLVMKLAPNGEVYYLPSVNNGVASLPPSPTAGYSDTEVDYSNAEPLKRRHKRSLDPLKANVLNKSLRETKMKRTAGFGDLLKLVTLQSALADTKLQLEEIVSSCDELLEGDTLFHMQREMSQRERDLESRNKDVQEVITCTGNLRARYQEKLSQVQERRQALESALSVHAEEVGKLHKLREEVDDNRNKHHALSKRLTSVRTTLIQSVANIFPIEPIEPRDLLFSIAALPLPIPMGTNDPAPPSTIPGDSSYNDETMAGALGYVGQMLNLVSAYLGDTPVYPIFCQGSRSMIKDPISAMMGPRVFPLYMKGAELYRFEYGVYLLNKNIEALMNDRDLRALDIRHTLPNLKNLILTLTSGEAAVLKPKPRKKASGPALTAPGTTTTSDTSTPREPSPSPAASEQESDNGSSAQIEYQLPTTPTASKIVLEPERQVHETNNTANIGTPGITNDAPATKRSFYMAAFLRARYPSAQATRSPTPPPLVNVKVEAELPPTPGTPPLSTQPAPAEASYSGDLDESSTVRGSILSRAARFLGGGGNDTAGATP